MKLKDLSIQLAEKENISVYKAHKVINSTLDLITDALNKGEVIYLRRLGKIYVRYRRWKRTWRTGGSFSRKESEEGYSLMPHIKLSKMFKRRSTEKLKSTTPA